MVSSKTTQRKPATKARTTSPSAKRGDPFIVKRGNRIVTFRGRSAFEDLGFSREATLALLSELDEVIVARNSLKEQMVAEVKKEMASRKLTLTSAAELLSVSRPRLSDIASGKFEKFSLDAAVDLIHRFGKEVRLHVVDLAAPSARAQANKGARTR